MKLNKNGTQKQMPFLGNTNLSSFCLNPLLTCRWRDRKQTSNNNNNGSLFRLCSHQTVRFFSPPVLKTVCTPEYVKLRISIYSRLNFKMCQVVHKVSHERIKIRKLSGDILQKIQRWRLCIVKLPCSGCPKSLQQRHFDFIQSLITTS